MKIQIFDPNEYPDPVTAREELTKINQWVSWKYVKRGEGKPTKPPVNANTGRGASHSNPSHWSTFDKAEWRSKKDNLAGVGFVLSEEDDYTGIDLDNCVDDISGRIEPWALEVLALQETYAEFSPSGTGIRMFVRGKVDRATKCDKAGVEIYGKERYMTVTWKQVEDSPDDIRPAPKTIAALLARVEAFRPKEASEQLPQNPRQFAQGSSDEAARAWAKAALEGKAAELAGTTGHRNHALNASAYGAGTMAARGWLTEAEVFSALMDACRQNGLYKEDGPRQCRASFLSGFRRGLANPHADLPEREDEKEVDALVEDIGRMVDEKYKLDPEDDQEGDSDTADAHLVESFPDHLTYPPGLVGDIVEWILSTSATPHHRSQALASALATVGAICGRYWSGPTDAGTTLFLVMLGPSGSGKDHFLRMPTKILQEADLEGLIGPSEFMSQSAIQSFVQQHPVSLCSQDEFGDLLKRMTSKKASSFENGMTMELRKLWGMNFKTMTTSARASSKGHVLYAINMTMLCAGTQRQFWESLGEGQLVDGFLNRFLIFPMGEQKEFVRPQVSELDDVPEHIIRSVHRLHAGGFKSPTDMSQHCMASNATSKTWKPVKVDWDSDDTESFFYKYRAEISIKYPEGDIRREFYARVAENALRIATVVSIGRMDPTPYLRRDDLDFGIAISEWAVRAMIAGANLWMSETEHQKLSNKVLRIMSESGGTATWRYIHQKMREVSTYEVKKVIESLIEGGWIRQIETKEKQRKGGHQVKLYKLGKNYD